MIEIYRLIAFRSSSGSLLGCDGSVASYLIHLRYKSIGIWWTERQGFEARRGKSRKQKWNRFGRKSNRFGMDAIFYLCEGNGKVKVMILDCTTTLSSECLIVLLLSYMQFFCQHRLNRQLYWDPSLYSHRQRDKNNYSTRHDCSTAI